MKPETRECPECKITVEIRDLRWVNDRYGIAYRKVCDNCFEKVRAEILGWSFDPSDAGESLEEESA